MNTNINTKAELYSEHDTCNYVN